jgi:RimJ/RimL family protein N-acetyltransferase
MLTPAEVVEFLAGTDVQAVRGYRCAAADLLPDVVARTGLSRHSAGEEWFWCSPRLFLGPALGLLVGSGGFKNSPVAGEVEIGYGVTAASAGRGYATVGVALLVQEALARDEVAAVTAQTSSTNSASERVLEKNGFVRAGLRVDPEEGTLTLWRRTRRAAAQGRGQAEASA